MLTILVGLVILAIGVATAGINIKENNQPWVRRPFTIIIAVVVAFIFWFLPFFGTVPAGSRGVKLEFGGVTGTVFNEGLYFVTPLVNTVVLIDVRTQAYHSKTVEAASHDLQTVHTDVTLNYHVDPGQVGTIYQRLGYTLEDRIIQPTIQEEVKATTASYEAEGLITKRTLVKEEIERRLKGRLEPYGLVIDGVNITNFDFSDEFNKAIEAKVTAEQKALQAKNDLVRINTEAEQTVSRAQAQAEAIRIQGEALKENAQLVSLEAVRKWDGKLPQYMLGNSTPFVNINAATAPAAK